MPDLPVVVKRAVYRHVESACAIVSPQVAINGSAFVLGCVLNKDKTHLEGLEWLSMESSSPKGGVSMGQRARLVLDRILTHELLAGGAEARSGVVKLTFDSSKSPQLEPADKAVEVFPRGEEGGGLLTPR